MVGPAVYWDSCTFLSLLQKTPGRIDALAHWLEEAKSGKLKIATSTATLSEVSREDKNGTVSLIDDELSTKLLDFFENDYIVLRPLDRATGRYAHELARSPKTARRAVDFALKRSGAQPENARVQRGCRALIDAIVSQFPKADRAEIFPRIALER